MYKRKITEDLDCGLRSALRVFGGKWKLCIIDAIDRGTVRPGEIHRSIPGATLRVVEMQLAELLAYEVVERCSTDDFPRKSEYKLTALGRTILPILKQIDQWGTLNSALVKEKSEALSYADPS